MESRPDRVCVCAEWSPHWGYLWHVCWVCKPSLTWHSLSHTHSHCFSSLIIFKSIKTFFMLAEKILKWRHFSPVVTNVLMKPQGHTTHDTRRTIRGHNDCRQVREPTVDWFLHCLHQDLEDSGLGTELRPWVTPRSTWTTQETEEINFLLQCWFKSNCLHKHVQKTCFIILSS